ncbi:MAG: DUF1731 domain-containing protein [Porphyromonas sp.]|nr:DUF1731 domain-containing protein [Porphyromonas sp.]
MKETLLLTCGDQLLASHFRMLYGEKYHIRILTRNPQHEDEYYWCPELWYMDAEALRGVDHIFHLPRLSFEPERMSIRRRYRVYSYHTAAISMLSDYLHQESVELKSFVVASSVDYYGSQASPYIYTERSPAGDDSVAREFQALEEEARLLHVEGLVHRVAVLRLGRLFCHYDGVLPHIVLGSRLGLSFYFGTGLQLIPWVHINDACHALEWTLRGKESIEVYNCVSPDWRSYKDIAAKTAYLRSGAVLPVAIPGKVLQILRGGLADSFINGMRVSSLKLERAGFRFSYPTLEEALANIYDVED